MISIDRGDGACNVSRQLVSGSARTSASFENRVIYIRNVVYTASISVGVSLRVMETL